MTDSYIWQRIEPYWFGRPEAEIRAAVNTRDEAWAKVPGYSRYEWSDKGRVRLMGRIQRAGCPASDGKEAAAQFMRTRLLNSGYQALNVIRDQDGKQVTVTVHSMVLLAHHPAFRGLDRFPGGLETRHNPVTGPLFNAYPEGLWPGTKRENEDDKNGPEGPRVQFRCRNAPRCRNLVPHEGRRCEDCVPEVGRHAAGLLNAGMNLQDVAKVFGYTRGDWTYRLAVKHGGYEGSRQAALAQRPTLAQRVLLLRLAARARAW